MTDLSPAAQAVWDAFDQDAQEREAVAAALRAAADHLKTIAPWVGHLESPGLNWGVIELESIAAELEGVQ